MKSVARNVIYEKRHKKHKKRAGSTLKCMHDILFDADAWERMEKHMISEGYKAEYVGKGNHDVYHKPRLQALQWQWYRLAYLNGFLCLSECKGRHIQS